jgi:gas vesicle protein GvpL/GvpF
VTLHVYALTEHPVALPQTAGIEGAALRAIEIDGIDAVVSESQAAVAAANEDAVLAHARVVDDLVSANDAVLPGRFTNGFGDEEALRAAIDARAAKLRAALERVRGKAEIGLRVFRDERPATAPASSGREYLMGRLAEVQAAERAAEQIHRPLAAAAGANTLNVLATPELLLSAAYLIPRAEIDAFRARVQELDDEHPELTLVCTGPWPPYSFATVDTDGS